MDYYLWAAMNQNCKFWFQLNLILKPRLIKMSKNCWNILISPICDQCYYWALQHLVFLEVDMIWCGPMYRPSYNGSTWPIILLTQGEASSPHPIYRRLWLHWDSAHLAISGLGEVSLPGFLFSSSDQHPRTVMDSSSSSIALDNLPAQSCLWF